MKVFNNLILFQKLEKEEEANQTSSGIILTTSKKVRDFQKGVILTFDTEINRDFSKLKEDDVIVFEDRNSIPYDESNNLWLINFNQIVGVQSKK